jgi:cell division protein FtsI (penicillin-binding protein 3)
MFEVGRDILKNNFRGARADSAARGRLRIIYILFVIAFIVFIGRTLYLGIHGTDRARRGMGSDNWQITRADIVDRNGDILAKNVMSGNITLRPTQVTDRDAVAAMIHNALPMEYSVSDALKLINSDRRFIYLRKQASERALDMVRRVKLQGLDVERSEERRVGKECVE